jgi:hypothetical protein
MRIIDLNFLFGILHGIVHMQDKLFENVGWKSCFYAKAHLLNAWRCCPFLDIPAVLDRFEAHGVPLCLEKKIEILPGTDPETFMEITTSGEAPEEAHLSIKAAILFSAIATAIGVPGWLNLTDDVNRSFYTELIDAGNRAREAQMLRNERRNLKMSR